MKRFLAHFTLAIMLCIGTVFFAVPSAYAQFGDPAQPMAVAPPPLTFGTQNPQLKNILQLQYQLQVLKQLIDHEKAVNEIVKSSVSLGIKNPTFPSPNKNLCNEVPANIPCAKAYENLYEGFSVERQKALVPIDTVPAAEAILGNSDIPFLDAATLPDLPADAFAGGTLYWTDITCLGSTCSAVISPDPKNYRARYRVIAGETLPDGSVIQSISASGVRIERGNKTIHLDPAPNVL